MLAVASPPPPPLQLDHDHSTSPIFGPLKPTNGALNNNLDELLKHPLEFKQGCLTPTSGVLTAGIAEGKYKPINDGPMSEDEDDDLIVEKPVAPPSPSKQPPAAKEVLFTESLNMEWAEATLRHPGFNNQGNTCFLNSVLQCLLHTPPLFQMLLGHKHIKTNFCMICLLRDLARSSFTARKRGTGMILENLNKIAKGMRRGRQEDAHEFLRYTVDALQRSTLTIFSSTSPIYKISSKIPPSLAETSWVHAIFGGRLRSRVSCQTCGHCSDTFDSILDLSIDIARVNTLAQALVQFAKPDTLSGEDAYRCEKCKKPVTAKKFMRIHEAPVCLTIHLKRFRPDGRKNTLAVSYPEVLDIQPYMSEGQTSKKYVLYGVIHHLGSGPNSGHYTAHVKGADGRWTMMDDEMVTHCANPPVNHKNAYVLFYMQTDKAHPTSTSTIDNYFGGVKRTRDEMETDKPKTKNLPWNIFPESNKKSRVENGAATAKEGVAGPSRPAAVAIAAPGARQPLVGYTDSDDIEDAGEIVVPSNVNPLSPPTSPAKSFTTATPSKTNAGSALTSFTMTPVPSSGISVSTFYGSNKKKKDKDKRADTNLYGGLGASNLHAKKESQELKDQMGFVGFTGGSKVKHRMKCKGS